MSYSRLYLFSILIAVMVTGIHAGAMEFYLYWRFPWFDSVVHLLGGVMIAFPAYLIASRRIAPILSLASAVAATLFLGVAWEVFEYLEGLSVYETHFFADTAIDFSADIVGALAGGFLARSLRRERQL